MKLIQNHYDLSKVKKFHTCAQYCGKKFLTQAICVKCAQRCIGSIVLTLFGPAYFDLSGTGGHTGQVGDHTTCSQKKHVGEFLYFKLSEPESK